MKNRIVAVILTAIMLVSMLGAITVNAADVNHYKEVYETVEDKVGVMEKVATSPNGLFELYVEKDSGELAVKNTKTGEYIFSNPYDLSSEKLSDAKKGEYLSQVFINYTVISSGKANTFYSYKDCFVYDQATFTSIENGIKVDYVLGEIVKEFLVPIKISVEDMNKLLDQIESEEDKATVLSFYTEFNPYKKDADGNFVYSSAAQNAAILRYPLCETVPLYAIKNVEADKTAAEEIIKAQTDYTLEQMYADYEKVKESTDAFDVEPKPSFTVSVDYVLTDNGLRATADASKITYDKKRYTVNTVAILPYFNAAKRADKGYSFLPDGSGALIRFEDMAAKGLQATVTGVIYGNDYAFYQITEKNTEQYTMPVFGLVNNSVNNGTGYFAIIEDGDALAVINSTHNANYNYTYATFKILPADSYDLADAFSGGTNSSNVISIAGSTTYQGKCTVNYNLLTSDLTAAANGLENNYDTSYFGMAELYRDYLIANGTLEKLTDDEINSEYVKIFLEVFGSMLVEEQRLTFPVKVHKPLTTFWDIMDIRGELAVNGVGNMAFILKGFANGGLLSTYPTSIKWQKVLGGRDGFKTLLADAEEYDYEVIPDVDFAYSYKTKSIGGIKYKSHAVKTLDGRYTTRRMYYAATQTFERTGGVAISSASFEYAYNKFYSSISDYSIENLAVRTLGSDLNSDFDKKDFYDREASKDNVVAMLKLLNGTGENKSYNLVLDTGNVYAMPYASAVLSASLDSSRMLYASEGVPFFGIVYHGSVEYAGNAINMEGDSKYVFLKALESGASLYFTIAKQNIEVLKFDEEYNKYYSVNYDNLKSQIISTYKEYNKLMKGLQNKYIVAHEFINAEDGYTVTRDEDGALLNNSLVVRVEYEGGEGFFLNYNEYDVTVVYEGKTYKLLPLGYATYSAKGGNA